MKYSNKQIAEALFKWSLIILTLMFTVILIRWVRHQENNVKQPETESNFAPAFENVDSVNNLKR